MKYDRKIFTALYCLVYRVTGVLPSSNLTETIEFFRSNECRRKVRRSASGVQLKHLLWRQPARGYITYTNVINLKHNYIIQKLMTSPRREKQLQNRSLKMAPPRASILFFFLKGPVGVIILLTLTFIAKVLDWHVFMTSMCSDSYKGEEKVCRSTGPD